VIEFTHRLGVIHNAVRDGDVATLKNAYANSWHVPDTAYFDVAKHGHVDVLRLAIAHGYQPDDEFMMIAFTHGHLACVVLAHENGAKLRRSIFTYYDSGPSTCRASRELCLKYVLEHGCPRPRSTPTMRAAVRRNLYWPKLRGAWRALLIVRYWLYKLVKNGAQYRAGGRARERDQAAFALEFQSAENGAC